MPTLDWIGKKAVVKHHLEVPYRLLRCEGGLSAGEPGHGNLLVQGDNLEALKALLPYYGGKVKCIYIDPPYNTGNEGWVYNDNVNSPEIRQWLGKVVGRDVYIVTVETCALPSYFMPPISGFRQNFNEAGRQLIDFLLRLMDGASPERLKIVHKMEFFDRS